MAYTPFFPSKLHSLLLLAATDFFSPKLFCAFQKVLASHGAAKVSAYVTHAVFPKQSYERFMTSNSGNWQFMQISNFYFSAIQTSCCLSFLFLAAGPGDQFAYFWITDSCPHTVKAIGQRPPFEVLSLAGSIADALQI